MSGQVGEFKDILRGCEYFYALSQNYVVVAHFLIRIIRPIVVPRLRSVASNGTVIIVMMRVYIFERRNSAICCFLILRTFSDKFAKVDVDAI